VRDALHALRACDVIVSSGGVSVGDHDHVKAVLQQEGTLDFWRIAIKPGKPLAFGTLGSALFFGLPGNPVSSLVTFELFVRPVLRRLAGHQNPHRLQTTATLTEPLAHAPGRREFVRCAFKPDTTGTLRATPTGLQGSHRLHSMVGANGLLIAHEEHGDYAVGETLPLLLL
jgi:molybdopterin molybdotransferase